MTPILKVEAVLKVVAMYTQLFEKFPKKMMGSDVDAVESTRAQR
jgi:hypothetical protein